jgi:hypothetical protein
MVVVPFTFEQIVEVADAVPAALPTALVPAPPSPVAVPPLLAIPGIAAIPPVVELVDDEAAEGLDPGFELASLSVVTPSTRTAARPTDPAPAHHSFPAVPMALQRPRLFSHRFRTTTSWSTLFLESQPEMSVSGDPGVRELCCRWRLPSKVAHRGLLTI